MKKLFLLLLLPAISFADRLGSLRSNADVLLTTQAVSGSSSLGVNYNGVSVTSPTAQINITGPGVTVSATGSTSTVTISSWPAGAPVSGSSNYWNYPSTGTFVDTQGISVSTITTSSNVVVGQGASLTMDYPSFPVSARSRIHWTSFGAENGSIGIGDSSPQGLGMFDSSGNLIVQEISSDAFGTTTKGFTIRNGGALRFYDSANDSGVHFVSFKASGTVSTNHEYTLPATGGAEGQVFTLHADSSTYWSTPTVPVTSVTGTAPILSTNGTTPVISLSQTIGQAETFTSSTTHTAVIQSTAIYVSSATVGFDAYADSNTSTAQTINWTQSNLHYSRLTGNVTYTFTAPPHTATLTLFMDTGNGSFTATWPAAVKWAAGSAPTITTTANKIDVVTCKFLDLKNLYYCAINQNF